MTAVSAGSTPKESPLRLKHDNEDDAEDALVQHPQRIAPAIETRVEAAVGRSSKRQHPQRIAPAIETATALYPTCAPSRSTPKESPLRLKQFQVIKLYIHWACSTPKESPLRLKHKNRAPSRWSCAMQHPQRIAPAIETTKK